MKTLLGPCDTYQLEPFTYSWAWDMARECEHNTWTPEEVPTALDVQEYKNPKLDPARKHIFEAIMAQLTTFDIQRGDDAGEILLRIIQPAEVSHFIKRLVWEEALHTRSYRFIIENLSIPLEIYDRWQTVPSMKARVDYANSISSNVEDLLRAEPNSEKWNTADKQLVLRSLIFWFMIFEAIWFMLNLKGPVQQLSRLGSFKGAAEQFQYIARDEEQHVRFGYHLITDFIAENHECWTRAFKEEIISMFYDCIELEADYAQYFLSAGSIIGYQLDDHIETAKFFAGAQCQKLGIPNPYPGASHQFPWMSEQSELKKEKNFFETRVTDYRTGGALDWGDNQ